MMAAVMRQWYRYSAMSAHSMPFPSQEPQSEPSGTYGMVLAALREWVERHPRPDEPVRLSLSGQPLSPRQLVREVERRSRTGREFVAGFERLAALAPELGMSGLMARL